MTKRVLVAVDGSEASNTALEIACALADSYDANLGLLCVTEPRELSDDAIKAGIHEGVLSAPDFGSWHRDIYGPGVSRYVEEAERGAYAAFVGDVVAQHIVAKARAYALDSSAKAIKTFFGSGDVADAILDVAMSNHADLIVMGHDHTGRLESLIKRSVAEKVERKAPCPCLIYCLTKGE